MTSWEENLKRTALNLRPPPFASSFPTFLSSHGPPASTTRNLQTSIAILLSVLQISQASDVQGC